MVRKIRMRSAVYQVMELATNGRSRLYSYHNPWRRGIFDPSQVFVTSRSVLLH
jgi:hypothetical protein